MMPKLHSTNFEGMELIRPLYYVREDAIKAWRDCNGLHFIQCACKFTDTCTTCTNNETKSKRMEVKNLIREMKKNKPRRRGPYIQEHGKRQSGRRHSLQDKGKENSFFR